MATAPAWRRVSRIAAVVPVLLAVLDLVAWGTGVLELARLRPGGSPMVPLTATCSILLAIGILLGTRSDRWSLAAPVLGCLVALIGGVVLVEYAASVSLGLDDLLFRAQVTAALPDSLGRPSAWTALCLVCLGSAVSMLRVDRRGSRTASSVFLVVTAVIVETVLVSHVFDATQLLSLGQSKPMSLLTALAFASLVISIGSARPDRQPVSAVLARADRGTALWVFPAGLLLPLALGAVVRGLMAAGAEQVTAIIVASVLTGTLVAGLVIWLAISRQAAKGALLLQVRVQEQEELAQAVFDVSPGGLALCRPDGTVARANQAFADILGRTVDEVCHLTVADFSDPRDWAAEQALVAGVLSGEADGYRIDKRYVRADGSVIWCDLSITVIRAADGSVLYGVAVATDIDERRREQVRLSDEARRDALTGMGNRVALEERLAQAERSPGTAVALLFVDLDDFKEVNDACGHLAGDGLLREVACRLAGCVRGTDLVARIGGDEFVVVADLAAPADVLPLLSRVRAALDGDIGTDFGRIALRASVGAALIDERGSRDAFLRADEEMYADKRLRRGSGPAVSHGVAP